MIVVYTRRTQGAAPTETERVVIAPHTFIGHAVIDTLEGLSEAATLIAVIDREPLTIDQKTGALVTFLNVLPDGMIHAEVVDTFLGALDEIEDVVRRANIHADEPQDQTDENMNAN